MKLAIWRGIVGILVSLGLLYGVLDTVIPFAAGDLGFRLTSTTLPDGVGRVLAITSGGEAAHAGIAVGDKVYLSRADFETCVLAALHPGTSAACPSCETVSRAGLHYARQAARRLRGTSSSL